MYPNATPIVPSGCSNDPVMANFRNYGFAGAVPKYYRIEEFSHTLIDVTKQNISEASMF